MDSTTETRRAAVTALAGLVALALPGAIASSDLANVPRRRLRAARDPRQRANAGFAVVSLIH